MKAFFDADILVFRCGFAAERAKWFLQIGDAEAQQYDYKKEAEAALDEQLPGKMSREKGKDYFLWSERFVEPVENALQNVQTTVNKALSNLKLSEWDVTMFLTGDNNFRYEVAKTRPYKGNRDVKHRPTHEEAIKKYIRSKWQTVVSEGEEADDALGIAQCTEGPLDSIIITQDKDLDMIPGLKYDFVQDESYSITEEQAWYNFCIQMLMGDATDNIPGLPGIGKQKAKKALAGLDHGELWHGVTAMYIAHAGEDWWEYMREQGKLLWIRREPDEIWEPPECEPDDLVPKEVSMYE
jgi:DNA polymerase-1